MTHHVEQRGTTLEAHLIALYKSQHPNWLPELSAWLAGPDLNLARRCSSRLRNAHDAEDAVQEISLKVIRAMDQFNGDASLRTWIISITENHCCSLLRKRNVRAIDSQLQQCLIHFESERRSQKDPLSTRDTAQAVRTTLQRLSDPYRVILEMRFFDGFSIAQLADNLNVSLSAAKMRLYRAMNAFRQTFIFNDA